MRVKPGQVPIQQVPLASIRPHPMNDKLYRPVEPSDPEVQSLAASIRKFGVKEPLVVTLDMAVLSGHRRRVAAILAGLETVPCRVEPIASDDSKCLEHLCEYNRQRVKSADEVLREEVVSVDPEDAHRRLVEHRRRAARVEGRSITLEGYKRRSDISKAKAPFLEAVLRVLDQYRDFWPLTDRQIHYALLNDPPLRHASKPGSRYQNNRQSYKDLCDLVTRGRLDYSISFDTIHDPTRPTACWDCHRSTAPFLRRELDGFLKRYARDLMQSQPNHVEIVGEKNTVESIIRPVAAEYTIPYTIGRGYASLPPRYEMAERFEASGKEQLILLILSDFDPEGEDIAHSFARSMRDDFDIDHVEARKVALTAEQVAGMNLPPQMTAKAGSSRRRKFVDLHGANVYELEAVPPQQLQQILRQAIDGVIDTGAFNAEVDREKADAAHLDGVSRRVRDSLATALEGPDGQN